MRHFIPSLLCLLFGTAALATVLNNELSLPELVDRSELIVLAKVKKNQSYWENNRIYTKSTLAVEETWINRNTSSPQQIELITLGGVVGDIGQRVDGMVTTEANDRVVLCLRKNKVNQWAVVGMSLGAFFVDKQNTSSSQSKISRRTKNVSYLKSSENSVPATLGELKNKMLEAYHATKP